MFAFNFLLDTETQPKAAASPQRLCSGQRQRYGCSDLDQSFRTCRKQNPFTSSPIAWLAVLAR